MLCVLRPIKKPLKSIPLEQNCTKQQIKAVAQISLQTERGREREGGRKRKKEVGSERDKVVMSVKWNRGGKSGRQQEHCKWGHKSFISN